MAYEIGLSTPTVPNRGFTLWIWTVVTTILAGLFVFVRMGIRFHNRRLGADDWTIFASMMSSVLLAVTECSAVHYGYGKHSKDIEPHNKIIALKWFFGAQVMYKVVIGLTKVSFFCLYLRIFIQPGFRRICYGGIAFIFSWSLAYILVTIFQCDPMASFWDKTIKNPKCVDSKSQWLSYAILNIFSDVAILALPLYPISQLKLARAKKLALAFIFGLGTFVCVTSIVRTTTLAESAADKDPTSGPIPATIWSVIEANAGIVCACLPVYKQPLQYLLPRIFGSTHSQNPTSKSRSRRKQTNVATGDLQDPQDSAWRKLHGSGGTYSNNVSSRGFEMFGIGKGGNEITQVVDVKITYQDEDDRRSDASSRPIRGEDRY